MGVPLRLATCKTKSGNPGAHERRQANCSTLCGIFRAGGLGRFYAMREQTVFALRNITFCE